MTPFLKILLTVASLWITVAVNAQGTIRGKLVDSTSKSPLPLATVTVFNASDTSIITYRLSNAEGEFRVPGLPLNSRCRVLITYSGYGVFRQEFTLSSDSTLDLQTIQMSPASQALDEILIHAERPPVRFFKDTVEFNASSFSTLPTALLEDLLKKLPGVQVDKLGNILVNGKKVNRILVDGKSFFGDDPKMATRNLPANVIDKVQVSDDGLEADRIIDGNNTELGKVINLKLKKHLRKGWFGKGYAGGGTKDRYEAGGIANIYRDTLQLSLLAFSNNINRSGFTMKDVESLGGFGRSGYNSMEITKKGNREGFSLDGISFGGQEDGLNRSTGIGFNLNHAPSSKYDFFTQYFLGATKNTTETFSQQQQFIQDTTLTSRTTSTSRRSSLSHNIGMGLNLAPDSLSNLAFRGNLSHSSGNGTLSSLINVQDNMRGARSSGDENRQVDNRGSVYGHTFRWTRKSRSNSRRTASLFHMLNYQMNSGGTITEALNYFYPPFADTVLFEQLRRQRLPQFTSSTRLSIRQSLTSKFSLRFTNYWEHFREKQDITTLNRAAPGGEYDVPDMNRSSELHRSQNRYSTSLALNYEAGRLNIYGSLGGLWQNIGSNDLQSMKTTRMNLFNVVPELSVRWKQYFVQYNQSINPPSLQYLTPTPDFTNPFYVVYGNPSLKPVKQHNFNFNFYKYSPATNSNYSFNVSANLFRNDIMLSRTVSATGIQSVVPMNISKASQVYMNASYGKDIKGKNNTTLTLRLSPYVFASRRMLMVNKNLTSVTRLEGGPSLSAGLNLNDKIEFRPDYSLSIFRTRYSDNSFQNLETMTHYLNNELIVRWPKKMVWEGYLDYRFNSVVAPGQPKSNVMVSLAATLLMLKDDKGMLKLSAYDLLNRNNNFYRYAQENFIMDQRTNTLNRYFLLSFTYNFRNMGTPRKAGGRERLFLF
jgi:hypothetical protein